MIYDLLSGHKASVSDAIVHRFSFDGDAADPAIVHCETCGYRRRFSSWALASEDLVGHFRRAREAQGVQLTLL